MRPFETPGDDLIADNHVTTDTRKGPLGLSDAEAGKLLAMLVGAALLALGAVVNAIGIRRVPGADAAVPDAGRPTASAARAPEAG